MRLCRVALGSDGCCAGRTHALDVGHLTPISVGVACAAQPATSLHAQVPWHFLSKRPWKLRVGDVAPVRHRDGGAAHHGLDCLVRYPQSY